MNDTVILVVSTGTGSYENCELAIGAVERAIGRAFPGYEVRRAFTGRAAIERWKERGGPEVKNLEEALRRAEREGIKRLLVQPTFLLRGKQYEEMTDIVKRHAGVFERTVIGKPLLCDESDLDAVAGVLTAMIEGKADIDEKTAVFLIGHGTKNGSDSSYVRIQEKLHSAGFAHCHVAVLNDRSAKEEMAAALCREKSYKKVVLMPLMLVSGFHAARDIAGEREDSWKSVLERTGFEVLCIQRGLGEIPAIRDIYVEHAKEAFLELTATSFCNQSD